MKRYDTLRSRLLNENFIKEDEGKEPNIITDSNKFIEIFNKFIKRPDISMIKYNVNNKNEAFLYINKENKNKFGYDNFYFINEEGMPDFARIWTDSQFESVEVTDRALIVKNILKYTTGVSTFNLVPIELVDIEPFKIVEIDYDKLDELLEYNENYKVENIKKYFNTLAKISDGYNRVGLCMVEYMT